MLFKLIAIALLGIFVVALLKSAKPEFAVFAVIATGVIMVVIMLSSLQNMILQFDNLVEKTGVDDAIFSLVIKIVGIGYLTEYSASIAEDAGCRSIAQKLQFGGKLVIFMMSIGIISKLIDVISNLLTLQ